jgi:hypothetical protein
MQRSAAGASDSGSATLCSGLMAAPAACAATRSSERRSAASDMKSTASRL